MALRRVDRGVQLIVFLSLFILFSVQDLQKSVRQRAVFVVCRE